MIEFDTAYYDNNSVGMGGFWSKVTGSHWCAGNNEAAKSRAAARTATAKRQEFERKYRGLMNSPLQNEIEQYENLQKTKEQEVKRLTVELKQTQQLAEVQGLGAWCRGANRNAENARRELKEAERLLGEAKEKYENQMRRHKEYLPMLRRRVDALNAKIASIRKEIAEIKAQIKAKKEAEILRQQAEKMRLAKEAAAAKAAMAKLPTIAGVKIDEQTMLLAGGTAVAVYLLKIKNIL